MIVLNFPKLSFQMVWKLETYWKLKLSKTNALTPISVSSWKPCLETWKPCLRPLSERVTGESSVSSLSPTPYRGSGYSPALTLGDTHPSIIQIQNPDGDAPMRHHHPHHTKSNGEPTWMKRV